MEVTLIFALAVCLAASAVAVCPSGWSQHGKSCYFLSIDARNWNNSMNACQVLGGYLAEIETKEENDFITAECFKRVRRDYWVGGMDINEGNWIWMHSGNPFNFTHWYPGEPNDMKINSNLTEDCLGLPNGFSYAWNDGFCHARAYYICEKDLKEISSGPAVPIIDYWVGGMDINEGNWIWMHSGNPFNFTHWYPGEPNDMKINSNLTEDCLGLPNGFSYAWNDGFCHARAYYICEKDLKEISSGPAVPIIG